jgi:hypothetical protein
MDEQIAVGDHGEPAIEKLRRLGSLGEGDSKDCRETGTSDLGNIIANNFKAISRYADSDAKSSENNDNGGHV